MWNSSMPTDPEAGSNPDQTSSDGSGSPSSSDPDGSPPSSTTSSAAPLGTGTDSPPGATTQCPCSSAQVTSETVMEEPPDRARTRLGVGEKVRVSYSLGSATWTIAGKGSLSSDSGATVTYTAPKQAGSVTLTATGCDCSASITFTIVEPNAVNMFKRYLDPKRVQHNQNYPDSGMYINVFLAPADVNFHKVQYLELEIGCDASGVYICLNGQGHNPDPNGAGATTHVQSGMGTWMSGMDQIYSSDCGVWTAPDTGDEHLAIPWQWKIDDADTWKTFTTVHQRVNCDATGNLTSTKAGAIATVMVTDATSAP